MLYAPGHSIKDQGIQLSGWGSGTVAETDEVALEGTKSVRITSRNYFQGGVMTFTKPVDLSKDYTDPDGLLEITFKVADNSMVITPQGGGPGVRPMGPGSRPRGGGAAINDGGLVLDIPGIGMDVGFQQRGGPSPFGRQGLPGGQGGPGGRGGPGMPGKGGTQQAKAAPQDKLENLRIIVTTTDNLKSEMYIPVSQSFGGDRGWRTTAVPLSAISGFERTNKIVKEIALSTDTMATIFIGRVRVIDDSTPITADLNATSLNLAQGDQVELKAMGYAGSTILKYDWDFDASDGIQVDATGPTVKHTFNKAGSFVITVTIRDIYNKKTPVVETIKAKVNP